MKKILKPLLIGFGILIVAAATGVLIYAKLSLTPEAVVNTIRLEIEQQLRREVSFREIEVGLVKGIILRGVVIHKAQPWEQEDFFACDQITMTCGFTALLFNKLVIRSFACTNPRIHFQASRTGQVSLYGNTRPSRPPGAVFELL
ncbi:MAG: hypothetical protein NTX06_02545, partial [Proteobacteria bacterium]|nr:hypothetical protein [Pseudomonadota bacterium]